jgi:phospholipase/carboxylesterase
MGFDLRQTSSPDLSQPNQRHGKTQMQPRWPAHMVECVALRALLATLRFLTGQQWVRPGNDERRVLDKREASYVIALRKIPMTQSFLTRKRQGPRPRTTRTNPHTQLDQNAPVEMQERLFELGKSLAGVEVGESLVSVPGARAFHLPGCSGRQGASMIACEFAHIHPAHDGSLHMTLPPNIVEDAIANGWAELHPLAGRFGLPSNIVMVYGPRDEDEFEVVADLLRASHALGLPAR